MRRVYPGTLAKAAAASLFAAALVAGCARAPDAPRAYADDAENHGFALDLADRKIYFIHGAYPRKSYLCVAPLDGGRARRFRLKGYTLDGALFPLPGGEVLAQVSFVRGEMNNPKAPPRERAALVVSGETGEVRRSSELPPASKILDAAAPWWWSKPLALIASPDGLRVWTIPKSRGQAWQSDRLTEEQPGAAAFSLDEMEAGVVSYDAGGGKLSFIHVGSHRARTLRLRAPGFIRPLEGNRWLVSIVDEEDRDNLALLDGRTGAVTVLLTADGPLETAAGGSRWVYAVSLSPQGPFDRRRKWLHPRTIYRADLQGSSPVWSAPWTQREGSLLAVDETAGRLWFAVTDRDAAAVWDLPAEPRKLAAAVPDLDGRGAFLRVAALGVFWLVVIVIGAASSMAAWFFIWGGGGGRGR
jgi:hypothetical protein